MRSNRTARQSSARSSRLTAASPVAKLLMSLLPPSRSRRDGPLSAPRALRPFGSRHAASANFAWIAIGPIHGLAVRPNKCRSRRRTPRATRCADVGEEAEPDFGHASLVRSSHADGWHGQTGDAAAHDRPVSMNATYGFGYFRDRAFMTYSWRQKPARAASRLRASSPRGRGCRAGAEPAARLRLPARSQRPYRMRSSNLSSRRHRYRSTISSVMALIALGG